MSVTVLVADPGSGASLTLGAGMRWKIPDPRSATLRAVFIVDPENQDPARFILVHIRIRIPDFAFDYDRSLIKWI